MPTDAAAGARRGVDGVHPVKTYVFGNYPNGKREVSPADCVLLRTVIDAVQRLEAVRKAVDALDGLTVAGSTGQTKAHPLVALEQGLRAELRAALAQWGR